MKQEDRNSLDFCLYDRKDAEEKGIIDECQIYSKQGLRGLPVNHYVMLGYF